MCFMISRKASHEKNRLSDYFIFTIDQSLINTKLMKTICKDLLNNQLDDFYKEIISLKNFQAIIKENTNSLLKRLSEKRENVERINENPEIDEDIKKFNDIQFRNFSFLSPYSGLREFIGHRSIDIQEQVDLHFIHKNKQYQWLLVAAYEVFEDFIESIYGCAGYIAPYFWSANDFGDISIKDIPSQDFNWFHMQAIKKKNTPKSILNKFRTTLPDLVDIELNNKTSTNYRLAVTMIENFRHVIVHRNGIFGDKSQFIQKVLNESDVPKKNHEAAEQFITYFTNKLNGADVIWLLEKKSNIPFAHYDILDKLMDILLAYAFVIKCELENYLSSSARNNNI